MKAKLTLIRGGRYNEPSAAPSAPSTSTPAPRFKSLYDLVMYVEGRSNPEPPRQSLTEGEARDK
jgi:hypothetical protein